MPTARAAGLLAEMLPFVCRRVIAIIRWTIRRGRWDCQQNLRYTLFMNKGLQEIRGKNRTTVDHSVVQGMIIIHKGDDIIASAMVEGVQQLSP